MLRYGFSKLGLVRIVAIIFVKNKGSQRVVEKAGFRIEGVLRKHTKKGTQHRDVKLHSIIESDLKKGKSI